MKVMVQKKKKECWRKFTEEYGERDPWEVARLARDPWRMKMSMRELRDEEEGSLEGDGEKAEALAGRHFRWEEGGRPLEEEEEEREGPGYSVQELVEKLRKALQGTSNTSAPDRKSVV